MPFRKTQYRVKCPGFGDKGLTLGRALSVIRDAAYAFPGNKVEVTISGANAAGTFQRTMRYLPGELIRRLA